MGRDAAAVIDEAKAAGDYVFAGGIDEGVTPVLVSPNGAVAAGGYRWAPPLDGRFTVLEIPSREEADAILLLTIASSAGTNSSPSIRGWVAGGFLGIAGLVRFLGR